MAIDDSLPARSRSQAVSPACEASRAGGDEEVLRAPGVRLRAVELGRRDDVDLSERVSLSTVSRGARLGSKSTIGRLRTALNNYDASPEFWANDVRKKIEQYSERMTRPDYLVPGDLPQELGPENALLMVQRIMREYGELLCWWPVLVSAARELRERGESLARPL